MQRGVDPAPRLGDSGSSRPPRRWARSSSRGRARLEPAEDLVARHRRPRLAAALVVAVEVAVVVVAVGRPARRCRWHGPCTSLGQLLPVRDVPDVLGQRPVRSTGVGRCRTGQVPGRVVEAGPGDGQPIPQRGLVRPQVAVRRAQVDARGCRPAAPAGGPARSSLRRRRDPAPPTVIDLRSVARRPGRRSPRAGRRARRSVDRPPRRPRTARSAAGRTRARGAPPPTCRPAR